MFDLDWRIALLLGTALAPTDPAVVSSALGRREVTGRTGVLLKSNLGPTTRSGSRCLVPPTFDAGAVGHVADEFALQMPGGARGGGGRRARVVVVHAAGAAVTVADLPCGEDSWVSFIIPDRRLVAVGPATRLRGGDEVLMLAESDPRPYFHPTHGHHQRRNIP